MKRRATRSQKKVGTATKKTPSPDGMNALLQRCGIQLGASQIERLWTYHQLLRKYDAELNLTRIHNFENMVVKLYADAILPALQHPFWPTPLLDLGTGPGMPGIPLAIFRPDLHILLAESRRNRLEFLKTAVSQLGLSGLEVVERGIAPDYARPVAGVITRAVEPIGGTLARVAGCLQKDGYIFFMKGPHCDEEIQAAAQQFTKDYDLSEDIAYRIPHTSHRRRLVVFRRNTEPAAATKFARRHPVRAIASENNAIFKDLKKLTGGRGVKKQGRTLVFGRRLTREVLTRSPKRCRAWISRGDRQPPPSYASPALEWYQLTPDLFQALDLFGTRSGMILYDCPPIEAWLPAVKPGHGCSVMVPFQDPENVGAVIRSAAAFEVDRIILLKESANPFHPKAVRASAGTVFSIRLLQGPSLSDLPADLPVIALAATGQPLARTRFPDSFCLLTGMEGPGLPAEWEATTVSIPMAAEVESLNAAVATAIALYEWRRRQNAV
ncbi:MAG: 16S rRNA (guanine(527)-N(7))-methyltransferase RsmG [Desulfosarcina sp.]